MSRRSWSRFRRELVMAVVSSYKHVFVVDGSVVGPSNPVYSQISRKLDYNMTAAAVYTYIKQNKAALAKYEEWGVRDDTKENIVPKHKAKVEKKQKGSEKLEDCADLKTFKTEYVEDIDDSSTYTEDSSLALRVRYRRSSSMTENDDFGLSIIKELRLDDEMKFMENFDPEKSKREQRKLNRKISNVQTNLKQRPERRSGEKLTGGRHGRGSPSPSITDSRTKRSTVYDDRGIHIKTGLDLCDCLNSKCEGCFFSCSKCRSNKCGFECRQNRRYMYESCEVQGTDEVCYNQFLDQ